MWGVWAGCLAILGLFNRTFSAGVDHLAFKLVRVQSLELAYQAVSDSYRAFHIFRYLNGSIMIGWVRAIAIAGLCVALIPLGVSMLREGPPLSRRAKFWILAVIAWDVLYVFLTIRFPVLMN